MSNNTKTKNTKWTYNNTGVDPVFCVAQHLRLLQMGHDLEADEVLCTLIEHLETNGFVPTKEQCLDWGKKNFFLNLNHLDFTYLRTISRFKHW